MKHILITTIAAVLLVGCGSSIQQAADTGNIEAVKQHLAAGVDVNASNFAGWTPLHRAANKGHTEIIQLLIANGADVNAKHDAFETTPLHDAARNGHKEVAELLIATSADVNAKDQWGRTPLHRVETKEIAEPLIAKGADVNAKDKKGKTPLDWRGGQREIADLLRKHGGKTGSELRDWNAAKESIHIAAKAGHIEAVKKHLIDGVDVNAKDKLGSTPLHSAAYYGRKEVGELLIANGADVNAMGDYSITPLDRAFAFEHSEIADLLRKHGGKTGEELK
jgi:ankyrin repeat protein